MLFWKKSTTDLQKYECFESIDDLPIKIWFNIHEKGDVTLLLKKKYEVIDMDFLLEQWESIYEGFIKEFGFSDEFLADLNWQINLAELKADFIITGQKHLKTLIKIEQNKFKDEIIKPLKLDNTLAKMSKYYGFKLGRDITVREYYSYIDNITNG